MTQSGHWPPPDGFFPTCYAATTMACWPRGQQHAPSRLHQSYCRIGAHVPAFGAGAAKRTNKTNCRAHAIHGNRCTSPSSKCCILTRLQQLGWTVGRNIQIDYRWSGGNVEDTRKYASELVALSPEVIFVPGTAAVAPLLQLTRSIPVVFTIVADPVGSGFVNSLSRPSGNATGFMTYEYGIGAKWLELLKHLVTGLKRVAVIRDPYIVAGIGQWGPSNRWRRRSEWN
jgi:hypothetical protein